MNKMTYRQGDVGFVRMDVLPTGAKRQTRKGDIVLALGEATGHAHKIKERSAKIFNLDGQRYLVIERPTDLIQTDRTGRIGQKHDGHDLHGVVTVDPGIYEVRIERSYERGEIVRVVD